MRGGLDAGMLGCWEAWMLGCLDAGRLGCWEAWMLGCLDAWMLGGLDAWMLGCLDAWMLGCLDAWRLGGYRGLGGKRGRKKGTWGKRGGRVEPGESGADEWNRGKAGGEGGLEQGRRGGNPVMSGLGDSWRRGCRAVRRAWGGRPVSKRIIPLRMPPIPLHWDPESAGKLIETV
jgi:hypothetical protein